MKLVAALNGSHFSERAKKGTPAGISLHGKKNGASVILKHHIIYVHYTYIIGD